LSGVNLWRVIFTSLKYITVLTKNKQCQLPLALGFSKILNNISWI
jgi:hypothetical protein